MVITTANQKSDIMERQQVFLRASMKGINGNKVAIDGWYTVYDLKSNYDIIVGKNWMAANPHAINHATNTLHMLRGNWESLTSEGPMLVTEKSIVGLRSHQGNSRETSNYCASVAESAGINLISAADAWQSREGLFVVNIRMVSEIGSNVGTDGGSRLEDTKDILDLSVGEFQNWRNKIDTQHSDLFKPPVGVPPPSKDDFRIVTDPLSKAPYRQPYRQSLSEREEYERQIAKLIANGWVAESNSRFAAPIIFVKKGDGKLRMCCDYRGLNKITQKDRYPLPYIVDLLDKLHGSEYFTKLDLASGYHQLRIHQDDQHKTAFIAPDGLYEWKVIPFGLANAPAAFMRKMNKILRPHFRYVVVYLDDILIHSKDRHSHVQQVEAVLQSIREAGLKIKREKCEFGVTSTSFVGYRVSRDGVDTEAKKVEAITSWPTPQSVGELRSFLGLAGYYRKFIDKFAHISSELHDLVNGCILVGRKNFRWSELHQQQFNAIKKALSTAPVLATLDPAADFILRTDASDHAIGAVLAQRQMWKGRVVERPLGFFSRKLHSVETRYPTYDRELLAIHDSLVHWQCYVQGQLKTTIYTDHASLQHVLRQRKLTSRQWRHLDLLQQHDYDIKYFPGASNVVADALSRLPHDRIPTVTDTDLTRPTDKKFHPTPADSRFKFSVNTDDQVDPTNHSSNSRNVPKHNPRGNTVTSVPHSPASVNATYRSPWVTEVTDDADGVSYLSHTKGDHQVNSDQKSLQENKNIIPGLLIPHHSPHICQLAMNALQRLRK
jgi:hypothetical protein